MLTKFIAVTWVNSFAVKPFSIWRSLEKKKLFKEAVETRSLNKKRETPNVYQYNWLKKQVVWVIIGSLSDNDGNGHE